MASPSAVHEGTPVLEAAQVRAERRHFSQWLAAVFGDALMLSAGFAGALLVRMSLSGVLGEYRWWGHAGAQYSLCGLILLCVLLYEGVYAAGLASLDQTDRLVKALTGGFIAAVFFSFATHGALMISRFVLVLWYGCNLLLFTLVRPVLRRHLSHWSGARMTLVIGDDRAACVAEPLRRTGLQVRVVTAEQVTGETGRALGPEPETGVYVACVGQSGLGGEDLCRWEQRYGAVGLIPLGMEATLLGATPVNLRGVQVYTIHHPLARRLNRALKRGLDLLAGTVLLALGAPLLAAIGLAVRLDSAGPLFYGSERLGRAGRRFRAWKFRTMEVDADRRLEELLASDPRLRAQFAADFKLKDDPRVTRLGRWLRRTSLDELPQLWNIVRGEMSLVGPRPIVAEEKELYGQAYGIVSTVRPGLTGLWQTSGRNDIAYESRKYLDLYYIRHWSPWLDLAILVRTVQALLLPDGY